MQELAFMKALTWKEPFATLMLHGKWETRGKRTSYRGKVLICSGLKPFTEQEVRENFSATQAARCYERVVRPYKTQGQAIAVGDLVDCRPMRPEDEDRCFVSYDPKRWLWIIDHVRAIEPFPYRGNIGWTTVDKATLDKIKFKQI